MDGNLDRSTEGEGGAEGRGGGGVGQGGGGEKKQEVVNDLISTQQNHHFHIFC